MRPIPRSALALVGLLAVLVATPALAAKVTFRFQPVIGGVSSVAVAGDFNGWTATANPMADADGDGIYEAIVEIPAGSHLYKYVVNGDQWFTDEFAPGTVDDGFGGKNGAFEVKEQALVLGVGTSPAAAAGGAKAGARTAGLRNVTFKHKPAGKPGAISLAGQFNDWTAGKTPMSDPDGDGTYTATLLLPAGSYQYKFVVDGTWTPDKAGQDAEADDGFGGKNSIVNVDDRFPAVAVNRGDGQVYGEGIAHGGRSSEVNNLGAGEVEFTTRAHSGDVDGVSLVLGAAGAERTLPLAVANRDQAFDYWRVVVDHVTDGSPYRFLYQDGDKEFALGPQGLVPGRGSASSGFTFSAAAHPAFETPDWVKDGVIYQIFPDRFMNGNKANDPDFKEWYYEGRTTLPPGGKLNVEFQEYYHLVPDWSNWQALTQAKHTADGRDWMAFYGGDLAGVRQKLDYLKDLGVTVIYYNPIFEARSTHKYDGADYRKIDPHFGTNEEFIALVREAKARGIRTVLDIVYNHSGDAHWAFREAAQQGPKSPHYSWFEIKKWPFPEGWPNVGRPWKAADYYYCWWGYGSLPDLNFDLSRNADAEKSITDIRQAQPNIGLLNHLLEATEYWLKDADVDGVRLDVPNEVPLWFWELYRARVKKVKPDAYVVAELWGNAGDVVGPKYYDAVMNYAYFKDPVQKFLGMGQGTAAEFDATLAAGRSQYPTQAVEVQMNLLDSHDTPRFLTQVGGASKVNRLKLAAMFGMTYVGAPHIYYGDEVGMEGGRDPDCRRPFLWDYAKDPWRVELLGYYKKLTAARHAHPALRTGAFRTVSAEGKAYGYVRSAGDEHFLVALNAGLGPAKLTPDLSFLGGSIKATDLMTGAVETWPAAGASIALPAEAGRLWRLEATGVKRAGGAN
jgi:cyclomaltodextrinase